MWSGARVRCRQEQLQGAKDHSQTLSQAVTEKVLSDSLRDLYDITAGENDRVLSCNIVRCHSC